MVSVPTRVAIWGRAGARCTHPDCRKILTHFATTTDLSLVGEVCHIRAKSPEGPRFDASYPEGLRESYDNLLLMCAVHHKIIDDLPEIYPVEKLVGLKAEHERWIDTQLSPAEKLERSVREEYSGIFSAVEQYLKLDQADRWLSFMANNEYPRIEKDFSSALFDFPTWAVRQFWPNKIPEIEATVFHLIQSIDDYTHYFVSYSSPNIFDQFHAIPKFYKMDEWNEKEYEERSMRWHEVIANCRKGAVKIASALNLLLKLVRKHVDPDYRRDEGWFIVNSVYATPSLSASSVPRYEPKDEQNILTNKKYMSVFNVES
ncbi:MAG: hypothetical protein KF807_04600 [Xanthobacteraceae bacterium]|nr:hypothetical protein [Xanthobacteraceae bacterium]